MQNEQISCPTCLFLIPKQWPTQLFSFSTWLIRTETSTTDLPVTYLLPIFLSPKPHFRHRCLFFRFTIFWFGKKGEVSQLIRRSLVIKLVVRINDEAPHTVSHDSSFCKLENPFHRRKAVILTSFLFFWFKHKRKIIQKLLISRRMIWQVIFANTY